MRKVVKDDGRIRHYYEEFDEIVDCNNRTHLVDKILKIKDKIKVICKDGSVLNVEDIKPSQHTIDLCKTITKDKEETIEIKFKNGNLVTLTGTIESIKTHRR